MLRRIIAQRARTARQGVLIAWDNAVKIAKKLINDLRTDLYGP